MVRAPCCEKTGLNKGPWTPEEDQILANHIRGFGHGNWRALPKQAGLLRCGKSCRLRWLNYLRPDIKRGNFTEEEEETIVQLHRQLGNRWSAIAASLPGRTDNEIKNVWHTHLKRRLVDPNVAPVTQKKRKKKSESSDASRLVEPLDRSDSGTGTSKNELHVESQIEGLQLETLSMDFTAAAAAAEFSTVDISTSIIHEFLEDSEMERFWSDALSMNVIATETPTDQSNSTDLSSCSIEMPDKAEDELHVALEIESFWLDLDYPLSIDFETIGIPTSPSHYFKLFNSDNDIDFWQEDSQNQEIY